MLEDVFEGISDGLGWGVGAVAIAAVAIVGGTWGKPLAKSAIKGYFAMTDRLREAAAGATESVQDLYSEAKHEYQSQLSGEGAPEATPEAEAKPSRGRRLRVETGEESV